MKWLHESSNAPHCGAFCFAYDRLLLLSMYLAWAAADDFRMISIKLDQACRANALPHEFRFWRAKLGSILAHITTEKIAVA